MCGIAGFVSPDPPPDAAHVLAAMTGAIRHRGPDDSGIFEDGAVFLGHRRLSIVDLAAGHQPMTSPCGATTIVYNGEIFNHAAVRQRLERAGHRYATRSDTETILHAYEDEGPACLRHFRGMFAFALWDAHAQTLFCARDRLGIKPFYYFWDGRRFVFASEIKALLKHPSVPCTFEDELLSEYLGFGFVSDERTLFRGIRKLMPGHWLKIQMEDGRVSLREECYWATPAASSPAKPPSDLEWIAETRRRLEETVRMRLMSDVPLGMFLSGGVDSSAIAALISRDRSAPLKTFAVGYREAPFSELRYAAQAARAVGSEHHEVVIGRDEFFYALPSLIWHEDEPIAWPSSVSLYFVSKLAATQVKVVLTGEGADELFGGYERYRWNLLNSRASGVYSHLPVSVRKTIRGHLATTRLIKGSLRRKLGHTFLGREQAFESLFLDSFYCAFSEQEQLSLLRGAHGPMYANYMRHWRANPQDSALARMLYADQNTYLVELLMKQDQMSMAGSLESRVPFLDHTCVEFAATIPDRLKIAGGVQKYVLKEAVKDLLPPALIHRKKMGFPTPLRAWLGGSAGAATTALLVDGSGGLLQEYVERPALESLLERHASGAEDATDRIWRLLNLEIWGDIFFTGRGEDRWRESFAALFGASGLGASDEGSPAAAAPASGAA
ncbi:MAG TPA: asparagine synthase (glutamine-hydrolyzing) [Bryobacteraceae bacterium]|nr:asparagine synthase (glutamine-hydrolyzing) [Bryobacteraceae bacterium]